MKEKGQKINYAISSKIDKIKKGIRPTTNAF
jgi:hypothetical protein